MFKCACAALHAADATSRPVEVHLLCAQALHDSALVAPAAAPERLPPATVRPSRVAAAAAPPPSAAERLAPFAAGRAEPMAQGQRGPHGTRASCARTQRSPGPTPEAGHQGAQTRGARARAGSSPYPCPEHPFATGQAAAPPSASPGAAPAGPAGRAPAAAEGAGGRALRKRTPAQAGAWRHAGARAPPPAPSAQARRAKRPRSAAAAATPGGAAASVAGGRGAAGSPAPGATPATRAARRRAETLALFSPSPPPPEAGDVQGRHGGPTLSPNFGARKAQPAPPGGRKRARSGTPSVGASRKRRAGAAAAGGADAPAHQREPAGLAEEGAKRGDAPAPALSGAVPHSGAAAPLPPGFRLCIRPSGHSRPRFEYLVRAIAHATSLHASCSVSHSSIRALGSWLQRCRSCPPSACCACVSAWRQRGRRLSRAARRAPVARRPTARACAQASCEGREWRLDRLSAVCGFFRARARCRCAAPAPTLADAVGQKLWSREAIRSACSFKLCALVRCAATAGAAPPCGAGCKAAQPARASSTGAARPTAACFAARLRDPAHRSLT